MTRQSGPYFRRTPDGWLTTDLWGEPRLLVRRDPLRGGWWCSRWSRRKEGWVPVPGSRRRTRHASVTASLAIINTGGDS